MIEFMGYVMKIRVAVGSVVPSVLHEISGGLKGIDTN
jgi:hypothetical protein